MPRLLEVADLCSSTVSDTANMLRKTRKKKSSAVPHISPRSHVGNLRQTLQGKGVIHKRVETAGVYPLVRPRGVSAIFLASQATLPPFCTRTQKRNTANSQCPSLHTIIWFPDLSASVQHWPHGGALLRSPEALSPALQRTHVSPGRCAYARDSRSYPRTDRAFSADD